MSTSPVDRIASVRSVLLQVPVHLDVIGEDRHTTMGACLCEVRTETGLVGYGFTGITNLAAVAAVIDRVAGPAIVGEDALRHERIADRLYWLMTPKGQTGYAPHAIAAIDVALWDIKGKHLGLPIWRILGGARDRVRLYTTFGFEQYSTSELVDAARHWVAAGHTRLKMTVGAQAIARRDQRDPRDLIAGDAERVHAVRDALGPPVELYLDANASLAAPDAFTLARAVEDADIGFFEEPITQNDVRQLADLRQRSSIPIAAGQNEGQLFRYRDLLVSEAVDLLQPNVVIGGGFSQCLRVAGLAAAFNVPIANGGGWPFHNMHLHGGVANGGMVEYHVPAVALSEVLYEGLPQPEDGWLRLPEAPGLGFEPRSAVLEDCAVDPDAR